MSDFMYHLFRILLIIPVFLLIMIFVFYWFDMLDKSEVSSNVSEGKIIDKQMNNAGGCFTERYTEYVITIEATYEYKGKEERTTKEFVVDKDIYMSYSVGDWFNSQNPVTSGSQN